MRNLRPTAVYLERAACNHEIRAMDTRLSPEFRQQNRLQAKQLRDAIAMGNPEAR